MENNYVVYHLHSDISNGVTSIDSVTKFTQYVQRAKECGMKALAFSEHGSVMNWLNKKEEIEALGISNQENFILKENDMDKRYAITMIALTPCNKQPRLYALGFTESDGDRMIPILCDYYNDTVWTFTDIESAKEVWNRYKNRLFERYHIQKHNVFISELKMTIDKVEELGE